MVSKANSVLIVDDSKENISALRSALEDNYDIKVAISGEMALKAMNHTNIDLVLLDVVMPKMDGFEVLKIMRSTAACKNIPVIFVTGADDSYSEAKGLLMGAVDYITKPYDPDIVSIKVRNQLENKMYRDKLESLVDQRTHELLSSRDALIMGMSLIAESRDNETGSHIKRMQEATSIIAHKFYEMYPSAITYEHIKRIIFVAPLHDVGKVGVSDTILLKPGKLTDEEFEIMKNHTIYGATLLGQAMSFMQTGSDELKCAIEVAGCHHERFDGTGYPNRLKGEEIPISARIVTVADVYDALSSVRVYKKAFTKEDVYRIILEGDGRTMPSHFDPRLLEVFDIVKDNLP